MNFSKLCIMTGSPLSCFLGLLKSTFILSQGRFSWHLKLCVPKEAENIPVQSQDGPVWYLIKNKVVAQKMKFSVQGL